MNKPIFTSTWGNCHIQGIAVDKQNGYIYYSFTTKLVKAKLNGEIVGSVDGLVGHLGCIAFNEADGCVYGSLEYKNDAIGKGILRNINSSSRYADVFYLVRFDASRIDRMDISAENNELVTAVYLKAVVADYNGTGYDKTGNIVPHKYGCSGIDGLTLAPLPGESSDSQKYIYVAYGVYSDVERVDNDYQVLHCYNVGCFNEFGLTLDQDNMHHNGPEKAVYKFFVYTGNTCYGVQNLEYDKLTDSIFMAVYKGCKPDFPNFSLFAVDLKVMPQSSELRGLNEVGEALALKRCGEFDSRSGIYGWHFPYGSTGLYSYGDGDWLISHNKVLPEGQCAYIYPYKWDGIAPFKIKE